MSRLEQLERLLADEPDDVFLNFGLAMELAKLGRFDEAVARFDRVVELDPKHCAAYFQKAKVLVQAGRDAEAAESLRAGIAAAVRAGDLHARDQMRQMLETMGRG